MHRYKFFVKDNEEYVEVYPTIRYNLFSLREVAKNFVEEYDEDCIVIDDFTNEIVCSVEKEEE